MQQMVSLFQILLLAQHISGTIMPIIRSSRVLYKCKLNWGHPVVWHNKIIFIYLFIYVYTQQYSTI